MSYCSEWLECLSWSNTEFLSACLNLYVYLHLSNRQHCWRVTSQLFQCFGDLNLNQRRLEQDPGLRGPRRPGWRSTYSFRQIRNDYFLIRQLNTKSFRNDIRQHFWGLHGSPGPNSTKFLNNGSFHARPGLKGPLSPDEGLVNRKFPFPFKMNRP